MEKWPFPDSVAIGGLVLLIASFAFGIYLLIRLLEFTPDLFIALGSGVILTIMVAVAAHLVDAHAPPTEPNPSDDLR